MIIMTWLSIHALDGGPYIQERGTATACISYSKYDRRDRCHFCQESFKRFVAGMTGVKYAKSDRVDRCQICQTESSHESIVHSQASNRQGYHSSTILIMNPFIHY